MSNATEYKSFRTKLHNPVVTSSVLLCSLLLLGHLARRKSVWLRALHLPASLLGGLIGWFCFALLDLLGEDAGALGNEWFSIGWSALPGYCTNIVFCCLFLGTPVPRAKEVLKSPRREHLIFGLIVVFGQYVVSSGFTGFWMLFDPSLDAAFATVMPYGYAGGPVVAEAMRPLYARDSFDYPDGYPLALLAATVGMFVGVMAGAVLVNLAPLAGKLAWQPGGSRWQPTPMRRQSHSGVSTAADTTGASSARGARGPPDDADGVTADNGTPGASGCASAPPPESPRQRARSWSSSHDLQRRATTRLRRLRVALKELKSTASRSDHYPPLMRPDGAQATVSSESLDSLMFHICLVMTVMLTGYVLRLPFVAIEETFEKTSFLGRSNLLSVLPLFLFCLIAGLGLQKLVDRSGSTFIDRKTIVSLSNTAQDVLVVAAISRLGRNGLPPGVTGLGHFFSTVARSGAPFLLVCTGGAVWGVLSFWYIAPRLMPTFWAERALVEFGVSIGATSTGLLLLRMADPGAKTPVLRDFTFKQIFHVLITGGGFFDVLVPIPLCSVTKSAWPLCFVSFSMIILCLAAHPESGRWARRLASRSMQAAPLVRQMQSFSTPRRSAGTAAAAPQMPSVPSTTMRDAGLVAVTEIAPQAICGINDDSGPAAPSAAPSEPAASSQSPPAEAPSAMDSTADIEAPHDGEESSPTPPALTVSHV